MTQITIDIPEDTFKDLSKDQWIKFIKRVINDRMKRIEESKHFRDIVSKSKATEKDVEELTAKSEKAMMKHYSQYY